MKDLITSAAVVLIAATTLPAQEVTKQGGNFSLGIRNTLSTFSHGGSELGYGIGGHFRIQLTDRINTEWFADVLSTNIHNLAHRTDYHVGWSVMYYIINPKGFQRKLTPYVVAGHCFDHTRIRVNGENKPTISPLNSAVQAGVGVHYNITPKFDISAAAQYMFHLGKDIHAHVEEGTVHVEQHAHAGWQGHLLFNISANYKIARLWKPKK
jgi:opacity protein-like surface antigen